MSEIQMAETVHLLTFFAFLNLIEVIPHPNPPRRHLLKIHLLPLLKSLRLPLLLVPHRCPELLLQPKLYPPIVILGRDGGPFAGW